MLDLTSLGYAKRTYSNGDHYDGFFVKHQRQGKGKLTKSDTSVYEGSWNANCMQGLGTLTYANGDRYQGEFAVNQRSGFGRLEEFSSGIVYEGHWQNDERLRKDVQLDIANVARFDFKTRR